MAALIDQLHLGTCIRWGERRADASIAVPNTGYFPRMQENARTSAYHQSPGAFTHLTVPVSTACSPERTFPMRHFLARGRPSVLNTRQPSDYSVLSLRYGALSITPCFLSLLASDISSPGQRDQLCLTCRSVVLDICQGPRNGGRINLI